MNLNFNSLAWWQIFLLLIVCIAALLGLFVFNAWILSIVWNWVMVNVFSLPFLNVHMSTLGHGFIKANSNFLKNESLT